ncbi:hypothetical protein CN451_27305, partial [Priestia megaterium]|uniref:hypothetical protein n=1 Tax=Priestia megaterium TaxID=1404 RepID=UPI000BFAB6B7
DGERGKIVRSATAEVNATGRTTQGVIFAKPDSGDRIIAVARNTERHLADDAGTVGAENVADPGSTTAAPEASTSPDTGETAADEQP